MVGGDDTAAKTNHWSLLPRRTGKVQPAAR